METLATYQQFESLDIRVGTIIHAQNFEKAKKPAYQLKIDFGDCGIKNSSAQITTLYSIEDLIGRKIIAIINFPPKQIANFISECLVLGALNETGVVLLAVDAAAENGDKIA